MISAVHPGMWHPGVLAKYIITADHISNGRAAVNIVSGWLKDEFTNFGLEWLEHDERYVRTEEFIRVLRGLWTEQDYSQSGKYYNITDFTLQPAPVAVPDARTGDLLRRQLHRGTGHGRPGRRLVLLQRQGPRRVQGELCRRRGLRS